MSPLVVDASAALAWILPSQRTQAADDLLAARHGHDFIAPAIFDWEVRNAILAFGRRPKTSPADYDEALAVLAGLEVNLSSAYAQDELVGLAMFAHAQRLSLFDAAYLGLALERNCALASRDGGLLKAADAAGVGCVDLREDSQ